MRPVEKKLRQVYRDALDKIQSDLIKIYASYSVDGSLTLAEMTKYNRLIAMESEILGVLKAANGKAITAINRLPAAVYEESFYRAGWSIDQAAGVALKWGLLPEDAIKESVQNDLWYLAEKGMRQNSLSLVSKTITQGLIQGQSFPKMARALAASVERTYSDALRIVRTEGLRAYSLGTMAALNRADDLGVEVKRVWIATLDDRTRDSHAALDGKEADPEKGWYIPGTGWVAGPRLSGNPAEDINCRCDIGGEIAGLEPKLRRTKEDGVVPYTTYSDWKSNMEENGGKYVPERVISVREEQENFERNTR